MSPEFQEHGRLGRELVQLTKQHFPEIPTTFNHHNDPNTFVFAYSGEHADLYREAIRKAGEARSEVELNKAMKRMDAERKG